MHIVEVRGAVSWQEIRRQQELGAEFVLVSGNYHELRKDGESVRLYFYPDRGNFIVVGCV